MNLPAPSAEALAHQNKLLAFMSAALKQQGGQLSFADFMEQALYAPGLGYYSAGSTKLGADGDFVTAPMISPLFSICLANQCAEVLKTLATPDAIILELGAGHGQMAATLLQTLTEQKALPSAYWILEVSADLRDRQQKLLAEKLPDYYSNIKWLDRLPDNAFTGIILGNEVLDALPVHLFQIQNKQILEGFAIQKDEHRWAYHFDNPQTPALVPQVKHVLSQLPESLAEGYTSEIHCTLAPFIQSLSQVLEKGVMLWIDYGFPRHEYYHPSRSMGTLMCHYRHHAHPDPFQYVGLQDITAHVDFTALAEAADKSALEVLGFTHQAGFLLNNGLLSLAEQGDENQAYQFSQQIQMLTQPHEMGELFKVMALGKQFEEPLRGFQDFDHRHRL